MDCKPNYYSVILKNCSRRESLGQRLDKILLRGRLAIKLALDNIPSVIIYKGNTNNILPILNAFKAEFAAITVLPENMPPVLPLYRLYRNFDKLSLDLQALLANVPHNLWLGEAIYHISPASFAGENGALVITSHALYFIDKPAGDQSSRWLIIPYDQISSLSPAATSPETNLMISYHDATGCQNTMFIIPKEGLNAVTTAINQAKTAGHYLVKIKTACTVCDYVSEGNTDNASTEEYCHCGGQYQRTLITY